MSGNDASGDDLIPRAILERIYQQARAEFPNECCGYLRGRGAETLAVPCKNVMDTLHERDPKQYPRTARNGYHFSVRDFQAFDASFAEQPPATVIYHSHPRVGAYFSDEDSRLALAFSEMGYDVDYLVIDAQEDEIREALLFRREGEQFREIARFNGAAV